MSSNSNSRPLHHSKTFYGATMLSNTHRNSYICVVPCNTFLNDICCWLLIIFRIGCYYSNIPSRFPTWYFSGVNNFQSLWGVVRCVLLKPTRYEKPVYQYFNAFLIIHHTLVNTGTLLVVNTRNRYLKQQIIHWYFNTDTYRYFKSSSNLFYNRFF